MKRTRKLLTFLLMLATVFTMSATAFASEIEGTQEVDLKAGRGSITITNASVGETYTLYKIFDANISDDGSAIVYTTNNANLGAGTTWFSLRKIGTNNYEVTKKNALTPTALRSPEFKAWALSYGGTPLKAVKANKANVKFSTLAPGYYFLTSTRDDGRAITIDSANPHAKVIDKNDRPGPVDKNIILNRDKADEKLLKAISAEMNAKKPNDFELKFRAANYNKEKRVWEYYVADILPPGMTYTANSVQVKVDDTLITTTATNPKHYIITYYSDPQASVKSITDLKTPTTDLSKATAFKVTIPWTADDPETANVNEAGKAQGVPIYPNGSEVNVRYKAYFDPAKADLIKSDGRPNKNIMKWGWYDDPENTRDIPNEGPDSSTSLYQIRLDIFKFTGEDKKPVPGAQFTLQRLDGNSVTATVIKTTGSHFVEAADGEYWRLKNGKYTKISPKEEGVEGSLYESLDKKYNKEKFTKVQNEDQTNPDVIRAYVGPDGKASFAGLYAGKYRLIESVVPDGYSKIDDIEFTLSLVPNPQSPANMIFVSDNPAVSVQTMPSDTGEVSFHLSANIENIPGVELPSAGGVGTTLIYIVGAALVIGAGAVLLSRRRAKKTDDK